MKVMNSTSPYFGKFSIVGKTAKEMGRMGGSEQFLLNESRKIEELSNQYQQRFESPIDKIIKIIKRQKENPYDITMTSKWGKTAKKDKVFLELRDPQGNFLMSEELKNDVKVVNKNGKPELQSALNESLDSFEATANDFWNVNKK